MAQDPNINPNQPDPITGMQGGTPAVTSAPQPINTTQPSPTNTNTQGQINPNDPSIVDALNATGQKSDFASRTTLAGQYGIQGYKGTADQNTQLLQKYTAALASTKGTTAPTTQGDASSAIKDITQPATDAQNQQQQGIDQAKAINQQLQNNPVLQQSTQQLQEFLSPQATRDSITAQMQKLGTEQGVLTQEQAQLMNFNRIMSGSVEDIRREITNSGGFATESQVQNMAIARNRTLMQQANQIQDQITTQQQLISNDSNILNNEKDMANSQFSQNMQIYQLQQKNNTDMLNASKDAFNNIIKTPGYGYQALYASTGGDASTIKQIESTLGLPTGSLAQLAKQNNQVWSDPYKLGGDIVQKNNQTGEIRTAVNIPATQQGVGGSGGSNGTGGRSNGVAPILNPYLKTSYGGTQYVDLSSLTPSDKAKYAQIASQSGLTAILDAGSAGKLSAISVSKENLKNIESSLTDSKILNDKEIPSSQGFGNTLKGFFGDADVRSFNAWRTAIINNVQALAGGQGSGLRINKAEIDSAMANDLPVITGAHADNLATAKAKIAKLNSQLDTWTKQLLGGGNTAKDSATIPPIGTVISKGGKSYHVIDVQGNLQSI